jgi:hypothetical protein
VTDSGISCPWVWMGYSDTPHGPVVNCGIPAVLRGVELVTWKRAQELEREADEFLAKHPDPDADERSCDVCGALVDGRGDQKTCGVRCRQKLSYQCRKIEAELVALGYEGVREKIEQDAEFAGWVREAAVMRLRVSPVAAAAENADVSHGGEFGHVDEDEWLWMTAAPQPEQIVTGDQPAWHRVSRYDNPHHLRWPSRIAGKRHTVTKRRHDGFIPVTVHGPWGPFRIDDRKHGR